MERLGIGYQGDRLLAGDPADNSELSNHLDLPSQEAFEAALAGFEGTILASAHDRYFIDRFAQVVWHFTPGGLAVGIT